MPASRPSRPAIVPLLALLVACFLALPTPHAAAEPAVKLGVDVLADSGFAALRGQRVGLVAHPPSVTGDLRHTVDVLRFGDAQGILKLVALFGPEHGVYGEQYGGDKITDTLDPRTGLPVRSLYGKTRKPTPEMLEDIDTLVFDLQDIGARSYTFISTMAVCLEACIENGKNFVVLDRPNPMGGLRIEGPMVADEKFRSFISYLDVPYIHGMTMGELAQHERDRIDPNYTGLTVVKMDGWKRDMDWHDTGLLWVPTSPHIPTADAAVAYAATGILGELRTMVSIGVGYTLPFEIVGTPGQDPEALAEQLRSLELKGVAFRAARFKPFFKAYAGEVCGGVQVHIDPIEADTVLEVNFLLLDALNLRGPLGEYEKTSGFDKAIGTDEVRKYLVDGGALEPLFTEWRANAEQFRKDRAKWLLYE